ncbi:MAG: TIR domain-containing protein [Bacteroidota bacterium]
MDHKAFIYDLAFKKGDLGLAIEELLRGVNHEGSSYKESINDLVLISGQFHSNEKFFKAGRISESLYKREYNRFLAFFEDCLNSYEPAGDIEFSSPQMAEEPDAPSTSNQAIVFISYSHRERDKAMAFQVKASLEAVGIQVLIDEEQLGAAENIQKFILESVQKSDATVSIVSTNSLMSGWVAEEGRLTIQSGLLNNKIKFIPCSIDNEFFEKGYVNNCIRQIQQEIEQLNEEKNERLALGANIGTSDLDTQRQRLIQQLNNFPDLVNRLREHLTIDLSAPEIYEEGIKKVIKKIQAQ